MVHYKLQYFNLRGRGEFIRLIFHYKGVDFEDEQIPFEQWPKYKPEIPMGIVPTLYVDDKWMCQTGAIGHYLGSTLGLDGDSTWQSARCVMLAGFIEDLWYKLYPTIFANFGPDKDVAKAKAEFAKFAKESWPVHAGNMTKVLKDNGGVFLVGSGTTWVDFLVAEMHARFVEATPQLFTDYALLNKHVDMVMNLKNVREYIAGRPHEENLFADLLE